MERFSFVFLIAGLGFFALAFVVSARLPLIQFQDLEVTTIEQIAEDPPLTFLELQEQYPDAYRKAFGDQSAREAFAEALRIGHKVYIGEACWHCHSQQVRPVGGDEARFGRLSYPEEYNNELNYPPFLWGTRRVGPDLVREAGRNSNDWHVAHFWNPPDVSPTSVMPPYPWFFEADGKTPNKKGLSIIAYVQWLGSWQNSREATVHAIHAIERENAPVVLPGQAAPPDDDGAPADPAKPAEDDPFGDDAGKDDPFGEGASEEDPFAP